MQSTDIKRKLVENRLKVTAVVGEHDLRLKTAPPKKGKTLLGEHPESVKNCSSAV